MFPGLVQLADLKARAVIESPTGIVYHSQWPFPSNHYWWGLTWDNPQLSAPVAGQISYGTWDRGTSWDPSSVFTYQRIASTVETILDVLNRTHPDMSDNDRSDVQNIQTLFRMLELPQAPMNWNNWVPTMLDFGMVDTLLYRGAWVGVDNTSLLGDNVLVYPRIDDLSGLVEVRGRGTPNPLTVAGLMNPLTVIRDAANWNVSSGYFFIGAVGYNQLNQANYAADVNKSENGLHRLIRKFTQEDGWTNATSSYRAVAVQQTDPLRHHQYSVRGQVDVDTIVDVDVNDSVDYSFYVPVEDVGYHYLAWLSQTLGLPYLGG
jgi:hypothetical protein